MQNTTMESTQTGIAFGTNDNSVAVNDAVSETKGEKEVEGLTQHHALSAPKVDSAETETDTASELTASVRTEDLHQDDRNKDLSNNNGYNEPNIQKSMHENSKNDFTRRDNKGYNESEISPGKTGDSKPKKEPLRVTFVEPETGAQEWTYEDHYRSNPELSRRKYQRKLNNERAEHRRVSKVMWCAVALLLLEVAGATIAVMNHQEMVECCGNSIFSENERRAEQWNKIFYWIGIAYLIVLILIEIPTLVVAQETFFLFNPMVGYLLVMQMMYATDIWNAYIIYGLETVAMLGQSMVLVQMRRTPESCIHSLLNYALSGITVYLLLRLTQQGGYCIVNDRIQSVFSDSTCNMNCIDEASCFRCTGGGDDDVSSSTQCFIRFGES